MTRGFFASLAVLMGASFANASAITFTETVTASGSLGASTFTSTLVTLTGTGDTSNIANEGGGLFQLTPLTVLIDIASLGVTATLTDSADAFSCQTCSVPTVGISDVTVDGNDILDTSNGGFATYALATPIGPLGESQVVNSGSLYNTNMGSFEFTGETISSGTFTATTGTGTPEPAAMALVGLGLAGLAALKRRKVNGRQFDVQSTITVESAK